MGNGDKIMLLLLHRVARKIRDNTVRRLASAPGGSLKKESPGEKSSSYVCLRENVIKGGTGLSAILKFLSSPQTISTSMDQPGKGHFRDSAAHPKEKANRDRLGALE